MSRRLSLYVLLGIVITIGVLFYRVIEPFIFALLFAVVMAVLFGPAHQWLSRALNHRPRLAAAITTLVIILMIVVPLSSALAVAGVQFIEVANEVAKALGEPENSELGDKAEEIVRSPFAKRLRAYYRDLSLAQRERIEQVVVRATDGFASKVYQRTVALLGNIVSFAIGMFVVGLALYYCLADGSHILRRFKRLLPLHEKEEDALIVEFGRVCRGVIAGTVISALTQALLAGIGYWWAGIPKVFLWMAITMFFAFIPWIGAGTVVVLVAGWIAFEGDHSTAGILALYGLSVVAMSDNLIRAYVIGSTSRMNPLIAFVTVLGGLQLVGLWGIFVGPMIAALFYTSLKLLHDRLEPDEPAEQGPVISISS